MGSNRVTVMPGDNDTMYFGGGRLTAYDIETGTFSNVGPNNFFQNAKFLELGLPEWPGYTFVATSLKGVILLYNMQTGRTSSLKVDDDAGAPVLLQSLHTGFDGNIYIGGFLGASGFTSYNPLHGTFAAVQQFGQVESLASVGSKLYIGTYGNARISEYDPAEPWSATNPRAIAQLNSHGQDRPFALIAEESLNKLFIGTVPDYNSLQGALSVYDLSSVSVHVYKNIVHNQGVVSLVYKDGLVYGGTTIYGGLGMSGPTESEAKLFVFDPATNSKLFEVAPAPGRKVVSGLLAGPDGLIWGVAEDTIFKFDPVTRQVVYKKIRMNRFSAGSVYTDATLKLGADGNVYGTNAQHKFFMIKPDTMDFITIKDNAGRSLTEDFQGNLYMSKGSFLWKYTLPELPASPQETLQQMRQLVERYGDAGDIQKTFADELKYRLDIIRLLLEQGAEGQAVAYMQDFIDHINDPAVLNQQLISAEAAKLLDGKARYFIEKGGFDR